MALCRKFVATFEHVSMLASQQTPRPPTRYSRFRIDKIIENIVDMDVRADALICAP